MVPATCRTPRQQLLLSIGCLLVLLPASFHHAAAQAFEVMNGVYQLHMRYSVPGFSTGCPAELAIDTTIDSNSSVLLAAQLQIDDVVCQSGGFPLTRVPVGRYTHKENDIKDLPEFRIRMDGGFYGTVAPGDPPIACQERRLLPGTTFLYLQAGKLTWNKNTNSSDSVTTIGNTAVFLINRYTTNTTDDTSELFNTCGYRPKELACFPASATVQLQSGSHIRMDQLEVGHRVLVGNGQFSDIHVFGHKHPAQMGTFVLLETLSGHTLRISPNHLLPISGTYATADSVRVGDRVTLADGKLQVVSAISRIRDRGYFAPHTLHGEIVVDGIVASTYTSHLQPKYAHKLLAPARLAYRLTGVNLLAGVLDSAGVPLSLRNTAKIFSKVLL